MTEEHNVLDFKHLPVLNVVGLEPMLSARVQGYQL
jgi:hypothetical protein